MGHIGVSFFAHCVIRKRIDTEVMNSLGKAIVGGMLLSVSSCIYLVSTYVPADPDAGMTAKDWKEHRDTMDKLYKNVLLVADAYRIHNTAEEYLNGSYISRCHHSGCTEMQILLKTIKSATDDGEITPKEQSEIISWQDEYKRVMNVAEAKIKARQPASVPKHSRKHR